jgi:hypothetical protein
MSMVIKVSVPDETARAIEAAAESSGRSVEEIAAAMLIEHAPVISGEARRRLGFIGAGSSGDGRPTDIHRLRGEVAAQRTA